MSPLSLKLSNASGTNKHAMLGKIKLPTMVVVVSCPPIQSMVVVTSPMGDHAPPALAAMTTMPAKSHRVCLSSISLRSKETITIDVVKLSSNAEKKERQHADDPEHFDLVPGLDSVRDHPKPLVRIDQLNDGHRAHQEEQNAADLLHVVEQPVFEELGQTAVPLTAMIGREQMEFLREVSGHLMPTQDKQRPANRACHQRRPRPCRCGRCVRGQ